MRAISRSEAEDNRRFNIRLTGSGREFVNRYAVDHLQAVASCFGTLCDEEKEDLDRLLSKLSDQAFADVSQEQK
jgi:DNA-binding MarR family transcriptional regulator